jgi:ABC-type multidrug transport system fused ATPase/permease subunit
VARRRRLATLLEGSGRLLGASVALSFAQVAPLIPVALLVRHAFDELIPRGDERALLVTGALIAVLYVVSAALGLWARHTVLEAARRAVTRLRFDVFERLYALPRLFFDRRAAGDVHAVAVLDTERVGMMAAAFAGQVMPGVALMAGLVVLMAVLQPVLSLVLLVVMPAVVLTARRLKRIMRARTRAYHHAFDAFSGRAHHVVRAMTLTRVQGAEEIELERDRDEATRLGHITRDSAWMQSAYGIVQGTVTTTAGVVVLMAGGIGVARGAMSLGSLLAFYAILALVLRQLGLVLTAVPQIVAGHEALARVDALLEERETDPYRGTRRIAYSGAVAFEDVTFGYGETPVVAGVDLSVQAGERIAIIGPNGAGKSTLVSLLLGLYRPQRGSILADGVALDELDLRALRRRIGVVLQDPLIFSGTIAENIAYGWPEATLDDVRRAARRATADAFIEALPEGYATQVGEEGGLLSGGQRQRLAIARALLHDAALLVLDEPTSHLDVAGVAELVTRLRMQTPTTVIVISHDPGVAALGDRVYDLRDGRLSEVERPLTAHLSAVTP